ncbi:MAG: flagellar export chaperone FlgN [Tepidisphaeraceae bacterium]
MSVPIAELEKVLAQLVAEHRTLLEAVTAHTDAMRGFDHQKITAAADAVEASRKRIGLYEMKRKTQMQQVARTHKLPADVSLRQIAEAVPEHRENLTRLREALRDLAQQISHKTSISGRIAGAMLGHLNTVVRIVTGAMQGNGVYTKQGVPAFAGRIGVIEAVG